MAGVFDGSGQDTRFEILKTFASNLIDNQETGLKVLLTETMFLLDGCKRAMSAVWTPADAKLSPPLTLTGRCYS